MRITPDGRLIDTGVRVPHPHAGIVARLAQASTRWEQAAVRAYAQWLTLREGRRRPGYSAQWARAEFRRYARLDSAAHRARACARRIALARRGLNPAPLPLPRRRRSIAKGERL